MDKRNLGVFRIDVETIERNLEEVCEVFSMLKIIPLRVDYRPEFDAYEYLAIGERFEKVQEGCSAPEYLLYIIKSDAGNIELVEVEKL